jgi:hypothetical protein
MNDTMEYDMFSLPYLRMQCIALVDQTEGGVMKTFPLNKMLRLL